MYAVGYCREGSFGGSSTQSSPGTRRKVTSSAIAGPEAARLNQDGYWSPATSTPGRRHLGTFHEYNMRLAELRNFSDKSRVLVLNQAAEPQEEADYPIDLDLDCSTLLDDEDDGTLARLAEYTLSLVRGEVPQVEFTRRTSPDAAVDLASTNGSSAPVTPGQSQNGGPSTNGNGASGSNGARNGANGSQAYGADRSSQQQRSGSTCNGAGTIDVSRVQNASSSNGSAAGQDPSSSRSRAKSGRRSSGRSYTYYDSKPDQYDSYKNANIALEPPANTARNSGYRDETRTSSQRGSDADKGAGRGTQSNGSRETGAGSDGTRAESTGTEAAAEKDYGPGFFEASPYSPTYREPSAARSAEPAVDRRRGSVYQEPSSNGARKAVPGSSRDAPPSASQNGAASGNGARVASESAPASAAAATPGFFDANPTTPSFAEPRDDDAPASQNGASALREQQEQSSVTQDVAVPQKGTAWGPPWDASPGDTGRGVGVAVEDDAADDEEIERRHEARTGMEEVEEDDGTALDAHDVAPADEDLKSERERKLWDSEIEMDESAFKAYSRASVYATHSHAALPDYAARRSKARAPIMPRRSSRRDAHMRARIHRGETDDLSTYSLATLHRMARDLNLRVTDDMPKTELIVLLTAEIVLCDRSGSPRGDLSRGDIQLRPEATSIDDDRQGPWVEEVSRTYAPESSVNGEVVYKFSNSLGVEGQAIVAFEGKRESNSAKSKETGRGKWDNGSGSAARERKSHMESNAAAKQQPSRAWSPAVRENGAMSRDGAGAGSGRKRLTDERGVEREASQGNLEEDFESLAELTMDELRALCADLQVEGYDAMVKSEMITALLSVLYLD